MSLVFFLLNRVVISYGNDFITGKIQENNEGFFCRLKMKGNCVADIGMKFGNSVGIAISGWPSDLAVNPPSIQVVKSSGKLELLY
jgi:hypothetical protein